jgi:hypothetical protein
MRNPETAYDAVKDLLEMHFRQITMDWKAGGAGGGGVWKISGFNRTLEVPIAREPQSAAELNVLDPLYKVKPHVVGQPQTWDDYGPHGALKDDAPFQFMKMFVENAKLN